MKFGSVSFFLFFLSVVPFSFSQIESGKQPKLKKDEETTKKKKTTKVESENSGLTLFVDYSYASSFRYLTPNGSFFGEELGERANEKALRTHNFGLGVEQMIAKKIFLSLGLSSLRYGEKYRETFSDSLLNYQTKYSYIALPVQVGYKTGSIVSFSLSTGLQAQFLNAYKKEASYLMDGGKVENKDKNTSSLNVMSLASVSTIRASYMFLPQVSVYLGASYMVQLNSTYNKQQAYRHRAYQLAGKLGLIFNF